LSARLLVFSGLLSLGLGGIVLADDKPKPSQPLSPEKQKQAFAWFDSLGFPDLSKSAYVRVATGEWIRAGNDPPENCYIRAFLLKTEANTFTVFTMTLRSHTFTSTPAGIPEHQRVGYEPIDWDDEVKELLKGRKASEQAHIFSRFRSSISDRSCLFILARVAASRGPMDDASALLAKALESDERRHDEDKRSLSEQVADDIAHSLIWRAVVEFGNPSVSRKQLLAQFERVLKCYPADAKAKPASYERRTEIGDDYRAEAEEYATLLKKMIAEDEAHDKKRALAEKEMTTKERVAELIFQLRDQNGQQWSQPGACNIFNDPREEKSPAHQLAALGFDAVPQLIEALEYKRLTRSVGFHRDFYYSHHVLRVGDCAEDIIERIAARSFWRGKTTNSAMLKDGESSETKKQIEAWWQDIQKKGEKQVLIETVAVGDQTSRKQASRLVKKYPDAAFDAISKGIEHATDEYVKDRLIHRVVELTDTRVVPLLRKLLKDRELSTRVTAAEELLNKNNDEGVHVLIQEWKELLTSANPDANAHRYIMFLAASCRLDAVTALGENLEKRSARVRFWIVQDLASKDDSPFRQRKQPTEAVQRAVEDLLARELNDTGQFWGYSAEWNGKTLRNPRICDLAAHLLSRSWNKPDMFDFNAGPRKRDRQRLLVLNTLRSQRGMEVEPLPDEPTVELLPDEQTAPLLEKVRTAPADARRAALKEIEALGLSALPAVQGTLRSLGRSHPARADVQAVVKRLAFVVADVRVTEHSAKPTAEIRKRLDALKGKALETQAVVDCLTSILRAPPAGIDGLEVQISREGDGTGAEITLTLVPDKHQRNNKESGQYEAWEDVFVDGKHVHSHGYSSSAPIGGEAAHWTDLARHLKEALDVSPGICVHVNAGSTKTD
jgi:hypothetical protein